MRRVDSKQRDSAVTYPKDTLQSRMICAPDISRTDGTNRFSREQVAELIRSQVTVNVPTAARILGIGRGTAYKAVRSGDISAIRVAGRLLVPTSALARQLALGGDDS